MPLNIGLMSLAQLIMEGCELASPPELFQVLMQATNNDPCTTGCAYFQGGKCPAFQKYHTEARNKQIAPSAPLQKADPFNLIGGKWAGMTTAQIIAAEGNISRGEFQKHKQAGKYKE